jgi:TonB family protein
MELAKQETMMTIARQAAVIAALFAISLGGAAPLRAQSDEKRPVKHLVQPTYPELAKKLNLSGTVRVEVTIGQDGIVKRTRVIGGHPVLAVEAERAAQKSTFEPGPRETTETIDFKF